MPVTIKANSGGGSVTLNAGTTSTDTTLTLPSTTGTVINTAPGTSGNVLTSNGTAWTSAAPSFGVATAVGQVPFSTDGSTFTATQKIAQGTVNAGGTNPFPSSGGPVAVDFTSIPSWVKRVMVMFNVVSTNGTSLKQIQIGSGSVATTGYSGSGMQLTDGMSVNGATSTTGFSIRSAIAADTISGSVVISLLGSNTWAASGALTDSSRGAGYLTCGSITLSGVLDRVRITTVNGTDTFDAGSINILYE